MYVLARQGCHPQLDLRRSGATGPGPAMTPTTGLRVYCGGHGVMSSDECRRAFELDRQLEEIERRQREQDEQIEEQQRCLDNPDSFSC